MAEFSRTAGFGLFIHPILGLWVSNNFGQSLGSPTKISYDSEDEQYDSRDKQKFNFLAKKTSKSKRKFNIDPFVLIEHLLSDHEDDDQEVEDDDEASIEDNDLEQNVNFDAPESGYGDADSDTPNINIDQGFAWIVY